MKKVISFLAVLAVVVTGSVVLTGCTTTSSPDAAAGVAVAGYTDYSAGAVAKAQAEGKDVVVFFNSKTCGSCGKLDADIIANASKIPANTIVFKADWDENQDLAVQYGVDKYHTVTYLASKNNVKGLFTLDDVMKGFGSPAAVQIAPAAKPSAQPKPSAQVQPKPSAVKLAGYDTYSPEKLAAAQAEGKDVALFFHKSTCGSCGKLDADIAANASKIGANTVVLKTDWDSNQDLAVKYGVDKYHTLTYLGDTTRNVRGLFTLNEVIAGF